MQSRDIGQDFERLVFTGENLTLFSSHKRALFDIVVTV